MLHYWTKRGSSQMLSVSGVFTTPKPVAGSIFIFTVCHVYPTCSWLWTTDKKSNNLEKCWIYEINLDNQTIWIIWIYLFTAIRCISMFPDGTVTLFLVRYVVQCIDMCYANKSSSNVPHVGKNTSCLHPFFLGHFIITIIIGDILSFKCNKLSLSLINGS